MSLPVLGTIRTHATEKEKRALHGAARRDAGFSRSSFRLDPSPRLRCFSLSLSLSIFKGMPGLKEVGEGNRRCRSEAKRSWRASYQELVESINIDNYMGFSKGE